MDNKDLNSVEFKRSNIKADDNSMDKKQNGGNLDTKQGMKKPPHKSKLRDTVRRYLFLIVMLAGLGALLIFDIDRGTSALDTTWFTVKEMLFVIPPIFILLGLLDVWVPREKMVKYMGEGSGLRGMILAILIGSAAAGPLYAAFPVAAVLMKKGAKFSNVLLFIGAWSTTKIPMVAFETSSLGWRFALTRLALSLVGIIVIAFVLNRVIKKDEVAAMYARVEQM